MVTLSLRHKVPRWHKPRSN